MITRTKPIARNKRPNAKRPGPPRRGRLHDPKYLAWIREQRCIVPGCSDRVEAAHIGAHAIGQKASDHSTLPVCGWHHTGDVLSLHSKGRLFWDYWSLDRDELIATYRARYLEEFPERATV